MISDNAFMIVKTILDYINVFFVIYLIGYSSFLFLAVVVGSSELYKKRHQEKMKNTLLQNYYVPSALLFLHIMKK